MIISIKWDDVDILSVTKKHNLYISSIKIENLDYAVKKGMPISIISNVKLISKDLPDIVKDRLPNINIIKKEIKLVSENMESNILEYINSTKCKNMVDKFTFYISK